MALVINRSLSFLPASESQQGNKPNWNVVVEKVKRFSCPWVLSSASLSLCKTQKMLPQYIEYASTPRELRWQQLFQDHRDSPLSRKPNSKLLTDPFGFFPQTLELYNVPNEQDGCSLQAGRILQTAFSCIHRESLEFGGREARCLVSQEPESRLWASLGQRFCGWHSINIWRIT